MKTAKYRVSSDYTTRHVLVEKDGHKTPGKVEREIEVDYDESAPCVVCGLPVTSASMGGTDLCPWCDCGKYRDGTPMMETNKERIRRKAKEIFGRMNLRRI